MINFAEAAFRDLELIRERAPLIHNITNYVAMEFSANALLSVGASPVMAHAYEEVADMAAIAEALVLNIGTLSSHWIMAMHRAAQIAFAKNTPIVLDPVGVGATAYRTDAAQGLLSTARPMVIRGNASEVAALAGDLAVETKGVDSSMGVDDAGRAARLLAEMTHGAVTVSGAIDLVVSSAGMFRIENGHPLMSRVTGMGCVASALTGAFCSVNSSPLKAAAHTMLVMGVAGELAAKKASGPGSFKTVFLDVLYNLNKEDLVDHARLQTA